MQRLLRKKSNSLFTPSYLYDKSLIINNLSFLQKRFFPCNADIFFAIKANTSISILKIIKELGAGAEVVSPGEIFISLRAGFKPEKILYNNIARKEEEVMYAIKKGILYFNFESIDQAMLLERCARKLKRKIKAFVRINPGIFLDIHHHLSTGSPESKFGINFEELKEGLNKIKKFKFVELIGIHSHIGSQILKPTPFVKGAKKVEEILLFLKEKGVNITHVNLGGGFGVPYHPDERELDFEPIVENYKKLYKNYGLKIFLEPGRFIVANAGFILTRVISVKRRKGLPVYILDAGMTENPRPALYKAYHHIEPLLDKKGKKFESRVTGPLCENSDEFGIYNLPELKIGDLLLIYNCGAYTRTMASNYNGRLLPPEYLFDRKFKVIRKRQKLESLIKDEKY